VKVDLSLNFLRVCCTKPVRSSVLYGWFNPYFL